MNLRNMGKIASKEDIRGLPELKIKKGKFCGECQIGKQTKTFHKSLSHITTSRVPKLLHMDLMDPMQVESLREKKYIFVDVDDYSRIHFTWFEFLHEK